MVVCPIAIAISCKRCPVLSVCPVKTSLGDFKPEPPAVSTTPAAKAP